MNRRDSIRVIGLGTLATGLMLESFTHPEPAIELTEKPLPPEPGREAFEIARDKKLKAERFFTPHELLTITVLADIIIPRDKRSGSASEAKVPAFIEFIVKDMPAHQLPMRGGLKWLDMQCLNRHNHTFAACTRRQQLTLIDEIAYPQTAKPEMQPGVIFFNRMRDLTISGFYTTKMGIDDLGYIGNSPGRWTGVPADILAHYGFNDND